MHDWLQCHSHNEIKSTKADLTNQTGSVDDRYLDELQQIKIKMTKIYSVFPLTDMLIFYQSVLYITYILKPMMLK